MITSALNALLFDDKGRQYIDLCAGYGSVWLGHNHPAVNRALSAQLEGYSAPGYLPGAALAAAQEAFSDFMPSGHFLGGIYSTGMEAVETALRAAWAHTGRLDIAGFAGSTHGRSFLTSALGAAAPDAARPFVHHLPSFAAGADALGAALVRLAKEVKLAAVIVEPVQMTGGGHEIPAVVCRQLLALAREEGMVTIFDETLTGLYRCGTRYYWERAGEPPDIVVLGKGLANGFPASAVVLRQGVAWDRARVRPGSTYWNHPLASAAVAATLRELARTADAPAKVRAIERTIVESLERCELRGRGAMWCLGVPQSDRQARFAEAIFDAGVVVSYYDRYVRLLPPLTIGLDELTRACASIAAAYADTFG
jgi:acetylornithine/succinyldiaminopimelate/putrescine aminotransferase